MLVSLKNIDIWANLAKTFYGNSENYYLSIGLEKSKLVCLFWLGSSKPNKKVGQLGGPIGLHVLQNFQA